MDEPGPEGLELAPELLEVDFERVGSRVEVPVPHVLVDPLAREDLAGMAEEERQQRQFLGGEVERPAGSLGALRDQVDADVAVAEDQARWPLATTDQGADAGQQLGEREGLAKIIIGPAVEAPTRSSTSSLAVRKMTGASPPDWR